MAAFGIKYFHSDPVCTDAVLMYYNKQQQPRPSIQVTTRLWFYNGNFSFDGGMFQLRHTWCISKRFSRGTLTQTDHIWGRPNMSCWNGDAPNIDLFGAMAFTGKNVRQNGPTCHWGTIAPPGVSDVSDDGSGGGVADPARCSRSRHLLTESFEMFRQLLFTQ